MAKTSANVIPPNTSSTVWPLIATVCAKDPGDAEACAKFSVSKSWSATLIEIPTPATEGTTLTAEAEPVAAEQEIGSKVSDKGCSLNPSAKETSYGSFALPGLIFACLLFVRLREV